MIVRFKGEGYKLASAQYKTIEVNGNTMTVKKKKKKFRVLVLLY